MSPTGSMTLQTRLLSRAVFRVLFYTFAEKEGMLRSCNDIAVHLVLQRASKG